MAYIPKQWVCGEDITDTDLNHMELGIKSASEKNDATDALETQVDLLEARVDNIVAPSGTAPNPDEIIDARLGADGTQYNSLGNAIRGQVTDLKSELNNIVLKSNRLADYLYKKNTYINASNVETTLNGYDLYKFPVSGCGCFLFKQTSGAEVFYGQLNKSHVFDAVINGSIASLSEGQTSEYFWDYATYTNGQLKYYLNSSITDIYVCIKNGNESFVEFSLCKILPEVNSPEKVGVLNTVYTVNDDTAMVSYLYKRASDFGELLTAGYSVRTISVRQGDVVDIPEKTTGTSYYGTFTKRSDATTVQITSSKFTVPSDGVVDTFNYTGDSIVITVHPKNSIKLDWGNITNVPDESNAYQGLSGVAFGTSLTYRAISEYGYLDYLPTLSGMTWDNQGIGSSVIKGNMLTAIKNYSSYANKDICILEGFVNDWYQGLTLGTYEDNTEDTVCGCVRSALNYMLSQNANMTIFLVLDPYGRLYSGTDCRSYAVNGNGQTQYEFYEEIAKVAASLGIPVIKQYAESGISENTPQYINDNIHPTELGAKQSAYVIWAGMKQHFPNQTT